ncbi:MAG TPA: hypothetical protein VHG91_16895, partial [Longimicrobium sp.]|nr:hypothetical protein [Longimicrobium sp.]
VLAHELVHTAQQRPWTGGPLRMAAPDSLPEREARGLAPALAGGAASGPALRPISAVPAVMGFPQAGYVVLVGAELACMFGFFVYALTELGHRGDKFLHCWTSCKIATYCPPIPLASQVIATLLGAIKEVTDVVLGEAELRDMVNNVRGIACSFDYFTPCDECCEED